MSRKPLSIRAQFRREGLRCTSVRSAARAINRLIGELRVEQNRRLAAEGQCVTLAMLAAETPQFDTPIVAWEAKRLRDQVLAGAGVPSAARQG